jgi:hypothetical protein
VCASVDGCILHFSLLQQIQCFPFPCPNSTVGFTPQKGHGFNSAIIPSTHQPAAAITSGTILQHRYTEIAPVIIAIGIVFRDAQQSRVTKAIIMARMNLLSIVLSLSSEMFKSVVPVAPSTVRHINATVQAFCAWAFHEHRTMVAHDTICVGFLTHCPQS